MKWSFNNKIMSNLLAPKCSISLNKPFKFRSIFVSKSEVEVN
ncbi:unnamed protein product [Schistosoma margrebowiei]|uniref:Uncharacterized protein n=1 Tax=Schistosoma margrebowiei TaxID=48269 RepID=A0A183N909_9TREM|nr:unnamed protein product [Schistosoma margrebowiei]